MASQTLVSFLNLIKAATITVSSEASGYPKANLQEPELLGLPWRSTVVTDSWIVIDLGSAIPFDRISLWGPIERSGTPPTVTIQQHTSDSWGSPAFPGTPTAMVLDPDRRVWRLTVASAGNFTRRYTRVFIPAQTPVGSTSYFAIAGIHMGTFTALPRGCTPGYARGRVTPRITHTATLGKWPVAYETGDPFARRRWTRQATKNPLTPGVGDEWATWLDIDRQIDEAPQGGLICVVVGNWGAGGVEMVRQENETNWQDEGLVVMRDEWTTVEAVAG